MTAAAEFRAAIASSLGHAPEEIEPGRLVRFATSDGVAIPPGGPSCSTINWPGSTGVTVRESAESGPRSSGRRSTRRNWRSDRDPSNAPSRSETPSLPTSGMRIVGAWEAILRQCAPVSDGDPVALYLASRRVAVAPLPFCLRVHRSLAYWHEGAEFGSWPAMVATLTSPVGEVVALHRTYLTADGQKAPVPTVKKLTGGCGSLADASIRLFDPSAGVLGVAEGIETALAARLGSGVPVVAAYSAGALAGFQWPQGLKRLIVFADADKAGREAADALRRRAVFAGLQCAVHTPSTEGHDWADVWAHQGASA